MMSSISTPRITAVVEIYENERAWIGGGFSKRGLLPTDRRPYSTRDGSLSWKTLGEAGNVLLGRGWVYDDDDDDDDDDGDGGEGESGFTPVTKDEGGDCTDAGGWRYATDFGSGSLKSASAKRGMAHFVRRRRLCRRKRFDPDQYLPREVYVKCEHCDSEAVDALSSKLLESLSAAAALHRGGGARMTDAVVLPLKAKLIDGLDIGIPVRRRAGDDASARLATIIGELDRFGERQQTALSRTCGILQHAHHDGDADGARSPSSSAGTTDRSGKEVLERYLGKEERDAIAGLVVRDIDPGYELHCDRELCGEGCRFQVVGCPNAGCDREISRTHLERHVGECGFGVVPCPNGCGDSFPRNRREVHLADACSLRDAECPFKKIGCTAVVPARDAPGHIVDNADSHLLMAANRMMEYETLFRDLLSRVKRLEEENTQLKRRVGTSATDLAAANSAIDSIKKKNLSMSRDLSHANSQVSTLSKKLAGLETSCRSEFKQINKRLK